MQLNGLVLSGGSFGSSPVVVNTGIFAGAQIYFPVQSIIGSSADGASIGSLTNYGVAGSAYAATNVPGRTAPTAYTVGGARVLKLDGYGSNQYGYNLASTFTVTTGSLFVVGWDAFGNDPLYQSRLMGFGGQSGTYTTCFFGWSNLNNASFLFRDTGDGGLSLSTGSSAGLRVFGIVKNGSSTTYWDNSTTPVSGPSVSGTYGFNTVGYRNYYFNQPSTGYLGDVAYWNTALTDYDAATVITTLKSMYNIA